MDQIIDGKFTIDDLVIDKNTKKEFFVGKEKFRSVPGMRTTRINSAPNKVMFLGEEFIASFLYSGDSLKRIYLNPVLINYDIPNYPDKDYQDTKWEFCVSLLDKYIKPLDNANECLRKYMFNYGYIWCERVLSGRDKYAGGNIVIEFER